MRPKKKRQRVAASVFLFDTPDMTPKGAGAIADWLVKQARYLRSAKTRAQLSTSFRARYYVGA